MSKELKEMTLASIKAELERLDHGVFPHLESIQEAKRMLAEQVAELAEFTAWKDAGKPCHTWWHRSTGRSCRDQIKGLKIKIRILEIEQELGDRVMGAMEGRAKKALAQAVRNMEG